MDAKTDERLENVDLANYKINDLYERIDKLVCATKSLDGRIDLLMNKMANLVNAIGLVATGVNELDIARDSLGCVIHENTDERLRFFVLLKSAIEKASGKSK